MYFSMQLHDPAVSASKAAWKRSHPRLPVTRRVTLHVNDDDARRAGLTSQQVAEQKARAWVELENRRVMCGKVTLITVAPIG